MAEHDPDLRDAATPLVNMLVDQVLSEVARRTEPDRWIPHTEAALGKRKTLALCRRGVFQTARKEGRCWLIRRSELDSYIASQDIARSRSGTAAEQVGDVLDEVGLELWGGVQ